MAGPIHWGTRPGEMIAKAKVRARKAALRGSSEGLTQLEKAFYEVYTSNAH